MKVRSLRRARFALLVFACVLAVAPPAHAGLLQDSEVTPKEKWMTQVALNEVGVQESPLGSDHVLNKPYGNVYSNGHYWDWCANFITWVVKQAGVDPMAHGRFTAYNSNIARAWAYYGANGGGYVRRGTVHDAVPGDILVHRYNGTGSTGGHVNMVVRLTDDPRWVWTVGGNEENGVRLRKVNLDGDLDSDPNTYRALVTLAEFRNQKLDITFGGSDYGDFNFRRTSGGYGPLVIPTSIRTGSGYWSGTTLGSAPFRFYARNKNTGANQSFAANTNMSTMNYANTRLISSDGYLSAQVTHVPVDVWSKPRTYPDYG